MKKSLTSLAAALLLLVVTAPLAAADLKADLLAREKQSWKDWADKKGDAFRASAVEDYVQVVAGFGLSTGREAVAKGIEGHDCVMKSFDFTDVTLRQPAPERRPPELRRQPGHHLRRRRPAEEDLLDFDVDSKGRQVDELQLPGDADRLRVPPAPPPAAGVMEPPQPSAAPPDFIPTSGVSAVDFSVVSSRASLPSCRARSRR